MSVGVSFLRTNSIHFVEPDVKVNGRYYEEVILMQNFCQILQLSELFYMFQQDSAPAHSARETVDLLTMETPDFVRVS